LKRGHGLAERLCLIPVGLGVRGGRKGERGREREREKDKDTVSESERAVCQEVGGALPDCGARARASRSRSLYLSLYLTLYVRVCMCDGEIERVGE